MAENRYFARSKAFFLPAGPWMEVDEKRWKYLKKTLKIADSKEVFERNGVEGTVVTVGFPIKTYEHIEPELYQLLLKGTEDANSGSRKQDVGR